MFSRGLREVNNFILSSLEILLLMIFTLNFENYIDNILVFYKISPFSFVAEAELYICYSSCVILITITSICFSTNPLLDLEAKIYFNILEAGTKSLVVTS